MKYVIRPGIVNTKICKMDVLIPLREASVDCKTVQYLPPFWAATYNSFRRGLTLDQIVEIHSNLTRKPPEAARKRLIEFAEKMVELGYFIKEEEETT